MRPPSRFRSALAALFLGATLLCVCLPAFAQSAPPSRTLADNISALSVRASNTLPRLQDEFISRLITWIEWIAVSLALVISLYSFARLW